MTRRLLPALLAVLLLLASLPAAAGGFSSLDFGSRRQGSFAVVGRPDDASAIFHNPAGLTLRDGTELYAYLTLVIGELSMRLYDSKGVLHPSGGIKPEFNLGALPFLAVTSDLGTKRWRLGVALYAPNGFAAMMPKDQPTRYHATNALFIASRLSVAAACEVTPRLSLGASVSLVHTYLQAGRVMNPLVLSDPDQRFRPFAEASKNDYDLDIRGQGMTWGWDVGFLVKPVRTLHIGAAFSSGAAVRLKGPVKLTGPDGRVQETTQTTTMALPFTLKAGFNWEFAKGFELGADVVWWHYQVLQEQLSVLSKPLLGIKEFRSPKNFGNGVLWDVGLVYHPVPPLELMAGFQMDFSPTPSLTYAIETPARDSVAVAFGFRWQVDRHWRVGGGYNRVWFSLANVQDSVTIPPTNAKGTGGTHYLFGDVAYRF